MFDDFDVSALDFGGGSDAFNAAADSAASYADGSALATMDDWQSFLPTEYDYNGLLQSLGDGGADGSELGQMLTRAGDSQAAYGDGSAFSTAGMRDASNFVESPKGALSLWEKLLKGTGVTDKNGSFDISNPKTLDATLKLILGGGTAINALLGGNKAKNYQSGTALRESIAGPYDKFNPQQQEWATKFFNNASAPRERQYAADMQSPVRRAYAEGGPVGALTLIEGNGGGQDDIVEANLAPGEFVWDAATVSDIGDGSNEQGAAILDQMRQNIREFKRSADPREIPPPTGDPMRFMPQGALSMGGAHGRA